MIELGGNISLDGFEEIEQGTLVVVKKVVGNYAKKASEKIAFDNFKVTLTQKDKKEIEVIIKTKDKEYKSKESEDNLFFALDKALSKVIKELQ